MPTWQFIKVVTIRKHLSNTYTSRILALRLALKPRLSLQCRCYGKLVRTDNTEALRLINSGRDNIFARLKRQLIRLVNMTQKLDKSILLPPESVRGMTELDRIAFKKEIEVPALLVPVQHIQRLIVGLKHLLLKIPHISAVAEPDVETTVNKEKIKVILFLLNPDKVSSENCFSDDERKLLQSFDINLQIYFHTLELKYENWSYDEIISAVVPVTDNFEYNFSHFSCVGHIIHVNLKNVLIPFRHLIGQVLLDKVTAARTVVNKLNTIDNEYRTFELELLAGEADYITETKENGFTYKLDFSKVFWNSRLGTEHNRIAKKVQSGDVIYDVFAGIGPFAIPMGKKKCIVLANDLNPDSYKWLSENIRVNKVQSYVSAFNQDGREFIRTTVAEDLRRRWKSTKDGMVPNIHIVMNLPALAVTFLDSFQSLMEEPTNLDPWLPPTVYCYCFKKNDQSVDDLRKMAEKSLGHEIGDSTITPVRDVSPSKMMYCISFKLTKEMLFSEKDSSPTAKRQKTDGK